MSTLRDVAAFCENRSDREHACGSVMLRGVPIHFPHEPVGLGALLARAVLEETK